MAFESRTFRGLFDFDLHARELDRAHVRHRRTRYDRYLMAGWDRAEARAAVEGEVEAVLDAWRG